MSTIVGVRIEAVVATHNIQIPIKTGDMSGTGPVLAVWQGDGDTAFQLVGVGEGKQEAIQDLLNAAANKEILLVSGEVDVYREPLAEENQEAGTSSSISYTWGETEGYLEIAAECYLPVSEVEYKNERSAFYQIATDGDYAAIWVSAHAPWGEIVIGFGSTAAQAVADGIEDAARQGARLVGHIEVSPLPPQ